MFHTIKCGTSEQYLEVLNFSYKLIPEGIWYDDGHRSIILSRNGNSRKNQKFMDKLEGIVLERSNDLKHHTLVIVSQLGSSDSLMNLKNSVDKISMQQYYLKISMH